MSYLTDVLSRLCKVTSAVPLGADTMMAPDDPILVHYVQDILRPEFTALGVDVVDLPDNQFAVRFGDGAGPCLALFAYTPTQHNNLMHDPVSGRIHTPDLSGVNEPCVYGQGVSQNKAHQACLLELTRRLLEGQHDIAGSLWLCINNEGRSSHHCSDAILDSLPARPDLVVELAPTNLQISMGNRGRVDLHVNIERSATHSSMPDHGRTVFDAASDVVKRVRDLDTRLQAKTHPQLGREHAVVYQLVFDPLAPHTIPSHARAIVDRRLLPGTDIDEAVAELAAALDEDPPVECSVVRGEAMNPAYLDLDDDSARGLEEAILAVRGHSDTPTRCYYQGAFDAGGPLARGIPTLMFGASGEGDLLGDDYIRITAVEDEAAILHRFVTGFLAPH